MELLKYQLTMFKYGKYFLEQHFDDAALAIKQGRFFMSASDIDHAPRGYSVTESATGIRLMVEGVTAYAERREEMPSAERTGHWIPKNYVEYFSEDCASSFAKAYTFECSECGTECPKQSKVCWECGCRMKGEEE